MKDPIDTYMNTLVPMVVEQTSRGERAYDIYSRMLDMDSGNLNARFRLGTLWAEHGQTAQALEQFAHLAKKK